MTEVANILLWAWFFFTVFLIWAAIHHFLRASELSTTLKVITSKPISTWASPGVYALHYALLYKKARIKSIEYSNALFQCWKDHWNDMKFPNDDVQAISSSYTTYRTKLEEAGIVSVGHDLPPISLINEEQIKKDARRFEDAAKLAATGV